MVEYNFNCIERYWQDFWQKNQSFKTEFPSSKPKYYVLDMFPYPSGAGLHVGHPLGYIASDIFSRYKRHKGFNVLHPMGFDAYGLPAEQYAIQTGKHPALTTEENIKRYKKQLNSIGLSYDWDREVRTCDPAYYKWTQEVFLKLFSSYYNKIEDKAKPIEELISRFNQEGNAFASKETANSYPNVFSAQEWNNFSPKQQSDILMGYRLAYQSETMVNWCPKLGTVLANDEVVNGLSQRGGHPVEQKKMRQWILRISAYADRLLKGLDEVNWSDALKEMQKNWIGKSFGAEVNFAIDGLEEKLEIFTTRADTIFGVSFMVLCPEHELIEKLTTAEQKVAVDTYLDACKHRSERERLADVNRVSGVFTGSYAIHPFSGEKLPIWISDYVLSGYGSGAIMAVAAHDSRDYRFAKHFSLPIIPVVEGGDIEKEAHETKDGVLINSSFLNGLKVKDAIKKAIEEIENKGIGSAKINFRLRDAIFSRQRYWGEPFPIYYKDGIPTPLDSSELPLLLPEVDKFLPTESGEPPLARAKNWTNKDGYPLDCNTMPGFAGSSAYYLRYMDPNNSSELLSEESEKYWNGVDLYIGGVEHATGHLIYSRFWYKFLHDLGVVSGEEPYKRLINQGMIQGRSSFAYRLNYSSYKEYLSKNPGYKGLKGVTSKDVEEGSRLIFVSKNIEGREFFCDAVHADIHMVDNDVLDTEAFRNWMPDLAKSEFICEEDGKFICGSEVEKMSKSMFNVENPDDLIEKYGADTLRMYEMFLGPIEQSKPWDTKGIEGVHRFLKKVWRLYYGEDRGSEVVAEDRLLDIKLYMSEEEPTKEEYKALHLAIAKIEEDTEKFSFNTAVSCFMITLNTLSELRCRKRKILEAFCVLLSPYAPHICEQLWKAMGHRESIEYVEFPKYEEKYTVESSFAYPVSFNGKTRFNIELPLDMDAKTIEATVLASEAAQKWLEGKTPKKVIVVPKRIINVVL